MYVTPVPLAELSGFIADRHANDQADRGYVPNYTRLFSLNPDAYAAWDGLSGSIRKRMRLRRYELATLAAAAALRCRYCVSAHGKVILDNKIASRAQLEEILRDRRAAGLDPVDVAVMDLAEQVALDASGVSAVHVETLRGHGLSDAEIFDVVLAAAARSFFSKALDAMGARPDDTLAETRNLLDVIDSAEVRPRRRCD